MILGMISLIQNWEVYDKVAGWVVPVVQPMEQGGVPCQLDTGHILHATDSYPALTLTALQQLFCDNLCIG